MNIVFRVGFWAVAVAMTTGCMAEAMDDALAEASAEMAPHMCSTVPRDALLDVSPYAGFAALAKSVSSPNSSYGTQNCPGYYVVDGTFDPTYYSKGRSYAATLEPHARPTSRTSCQNTTLEMTVFEASTATLQWECQCSGMICGECKWVAKPDYVKKVDVYGQGVWDQVESYCYFSNNRSSVRAIPQFGSRVAAKVLQYGYPLRAKVTMTAEPIIR